MYGEEAGRPAYLGAGEGIYTTVHASEVYLGYIPPSLSLS